MKRCGAKTRGGTPCQRFVLKSVANGRCRLHGGLSTGAKTEAGKARQQKAKTKHGFYTKESINRRREIKQCLGEAKALLQQLSQSGWS